MFRKEQTGFVPYLVALGALALALCFGLWFPDFDAVNSPLKWLGILRHRSILTHGFLIPLLLFSVVIRQGYAKPNLNLRFAAIGFFVSTAVHLGFDLFPNHWGGYALIHIPLIGWTPPLFSQLWIFGSAVICYWLAFRVLRNLGELLAVVGTVAVCYLFGANHEPRLIFLSLLGILPALLVAFIIPRPKRAIDLTDTPGMI